MSCASVESAELSGIGSGIFSDFPRRTDFGLGEFNIGALLEYCFVRSIQRGVADIVSSWGLLSSVFLAIFFLLGWILVFVCSFTEHFLLIVDVALCSG
ncbi:hypothetical protein A2U01_0058623, partial [Trifolium medium]|nr:hypothetical protein [Trifolium medium]